MSVLEARFRMRYGEFALDADLSLPARGVAGIFGASGSGKTTLLRCMAGLSRAAEGFFAIGEEVWQDDARRCFLPPHKRSCGYVFQEASLFPHLSVQQNLVYGFRRVARTLRKVSFDETVTMLDLAPLLDRRPEGLSGGERQRVAIGPTRVLSSPRLLLMDEPLASLDASRKAEVLYYIERLRDRPRSPDRLREPCDRRGRAPRRHDGGDVRRQGARTWRGHSPRIKARSAPLSRPIRRQARVDRSARSRPRSGYGLATLRFDGGDSSSRCRIAGRRTPRVRIPRARRLARPFPA